MRTERCKRCMRDESSIWWKCCPEHVTETGTDVLCDLCARFLHPDDPYIQQQTSKEITMEFGTFVRRPFAIEAIQITKENIEELAVHIGTLSKKEDGTPYIQVDTRRVPNVLKVFPGFWMTRLGDNIRCYAPRIFAEQFVPTTPEIEEWVNFLNESKPQKKVAKSA